MRSLGIAALGAVQGVPVGKIEGAAIFLGGSPFSVKARISRNIVLGRCEVRIERLRLGRRSAPLSERLDADDTHTTALRKGQRMTGADLKGGLADALAIHPHARRLHEPGCQPARLEKTRVPEPLVEALGVGGSGQSKCRGSAEDQDLP